MIPSKSFLLPIALIIGLCGILIEARSRNESRCYQFTWLGPRWHNESVFMNATCRDATQLASGVPCQQPLVVSDDGTWPDVEYIWTHYADQATCVLADNDVCAQYTMFFNGRVDNSTYFCTRAVDSNNTAITNGCYEETHGSRSTRVCFCRSVPGTIPYYRTTAQMNTVKVVVKNVPDYGASRERNDLGYLTFDLKTDLSNLFNWNVKQLFLYLTAEYVTPNNELNQVVLWDKIILRGENALLDFKNMNTKYYFWDDGNGLKGHNNVTLSLSWNIIPNAGLLPNIPAIGQHSFKFPVDYTQTRV
ncbi:jg11234 [Pararge aegeria aegeria]|uniref:Signal peptidase complex subunit 3 n=1 Tax=Pararge aegeria aegeria TaxID=348720 RepID=A0A8S4RJ13_9NEOP|nr:jg11234 [Pararge aegeria aegeria]